MYIGLVSDLAGAPLSPELQALERAAAQDPDYEWRQVQLLGALCTEELQAHPRRTQVILGYISRFPKSTMAPAAYLQVDRTVAPAAFESIDVLWARLRSEAPDNPDLVVGHAAFHASTDPDRAAAMLRDAIARLPPSAALWTGLGRVVREPTERLAALEQARALGSSQPNLLIEIGWCAVEARRFDVVANIGRELAARAQRTRATMQSPVSFARRRYTPSRGSRRSVHRSSWPESCATPDSGARSRVTCVPASTSGTTRS